MEYKQYTSGGVKINIVKDDIANLRLLQVSDKKAKLSQLRFGTEKPQAIINCSYFAPNYCLGRNQGDVEQGTSSWLSQKYLSFATEGNSYDCGELEYWDIPKSECGFTPAIICIKNGVDVKLCSTSLDITYDTKLSLATAITFFGILKDKRTCLFITAEKNLKGSALLTWLKAKYEFDFLCELDGGGSTEMIVNGSIVQTSTDGTERPMYNGLAFVNTNYMPRVSETNPSDMNTSSYFNEPKYVGVNNYYKGNKNYQCVAYANARSSEIAKKPITYWNGTSEKSDIEKPIFNRYGFGDAKNWLQDTNWEIGTEARIGAIMVYGKNYGGGRGHVRVVEKINGNQITYSAGNENKQLAFKTIDKPVITENDFIGYIYNPYVEYQEPQETDQIKVLQAKIKSLESDLKAEQLKTNDLNKQLENKDKELELYKQKINEIRKVVDYE